VLVDNTFNTESGMDVSAVPESSASQEVGDIVTLDSMVLINSDARSLQTPSASTIVESSLESEPAELQTANSTKLTRKRQRNSACYKRNIRKAKKLSGAAHVNTVGQHVPEKQPVQVSCKCRFKCNEHFIEDDRAKICKDYYCLASYQRQKDYILKNIITRATRTRTVKPRLPNGSEDRNSAKAMSVAYYLEKDGHRIRVCKIFFLKTLSISNRAVLIAISGKTDTGVFGGVDNRGRQAPKNKSSDETMKYVKDHIESFPRTESHYCRKDTSRQYLDSKLNITKMYNLYVEKCLNDNHKPVLHNLYRQIFTEQYNLGFFNPKKDQCSECTKHNLMTAEDKLKHEDDFREHTQRNKEAQAEKAADKIKANGSKTFRSITFDLQSVLQVPSSDASLMYYKRKLNCYNLTIYEQASPNNAYCYLWSEIDGKRGSNEIGTCLFQYLKSLPAEVEEVSMFSDTCGGQNRNQNIAAIVAHAVTALDHLQIIEQKFLEKGHSYMECDSMHASNEHAKKNVAVFSVSAWRSIIELARRKNPYTAKQLEYKDFLDLKALADQIVKNRTKDENGNVVNWLKINPRVPKVILPTRMPKVGSKRTPPILSVIFVKGLRFCNGVCFLLMSIKSAIDWPTILHSGATL
jgi:hypothetical protein